MPDTNEDSTRHQTARGQRLKPQRMGYQHRKKTVSDKTKEPQQTACATTAKDDNESGLLSTTEGQGERCSMHQRADGVSNHSEEEPTQMTVSNKTKEPPKTTSPTTEKNHGTSNRTAPLPEQVDVSGSS